MNLDILMVTVRGDLALRPFFETSLRQFWNEPQAILETSTGETGGIWTKPAPKPSRAREFPVERRRSVLWQSGWETRQTATLPTPARPDRVPADS